MIDYVEILDDSRSLLGIIDTAESIIWEADYYGAGKFEIYVQVNPHTVSLLEVGNYVARPDDVNVGIIESINITYSLESGRMISAKGRFAKSLLDRRVIYALTGDYGTSPRLSGLVETEVRTLVSRNIISSPIDVRNVPFVRLGAVKNIDKQIVDEDGNPTQLQTEFDNLLTYTDKLLKDYKLGAFMSLDGVNFVYNIFEGVDRSVDNGNGLTPIVFSQDFDNLLSSDYKYETQAFKTTALIGGEGEGTERIFVTIGNGRSGLSRREMFVNASSQKRDYKDENDKDQTYTYAEYTANLKSFARIEMDSHKLVQSFDGEVDIANSGVVYGEDFWLGDIVTIQDTQLSLYKNARIVKVTEVQDSKGYMLKITYGD